MLRSMSRRTALLGALLLLTGVGAQAHAAGTTATVNGKIKAVNLETDTLTIAGAAGKVALKLSPETVIVEGTGPGAASDLRVGRLAAAKYDRKSKVIAKIILEADPNEVEATGRILTADPNTGVVTVDTTGDGAGDVAMTVDAVTDLKIGPVRIHRSQLNYLIGLTAGVEYDGPTFVAQKIWADAGPVSVFAGEVIAIDPSVFTLSVNTVAGQVDVVVAAGAQVTLNGNPTYLSFAMPGDSVRVSVVEKPEGVKVATDVDIMNVQGSTVLGVVTRIDPTTGQITLSNSEGLITLSVDGNTVLLGNGQPTTMEQLAALLAKGRKIQVQSEYFLRGTVNLATRVEARVSKRGQ